MKRYAWVVAAILIAAVFRGTTAPPAEAQETRPNILIFVTDDQRAGAYSVMPETMRLFRSEGMNFTRGFTTTPTCCPARSTLFSGRYAHNTRVQFNADGSRLNLNRTIQAVLKGQGYQTALSGKYLNEVDGAPPHFDLYAKMSGQAGRGDIGHFNLPFLLTGESEEQVIEEYATTFVGSKAVEFLDTFEQADETPWFLYVAPLAPHRPYDVEAKYRGAPIPAFRANAAFMEEDLSDKPAYIRRRAFQKTASWAKSVRANQLRMLMSVDDQVEAIFSKMTALEEENTLAFFLSDNGLLWGEHGIVQKLVPYRHSIRVPLFMRWPGHLNAATRTDIAALIDVAPTIYDALGVAPYVTDGRSLFEPTGRRRLLIEQWQGVPDWAATWRPGSLYLEFVGTRAREYYDFARDPAELRNRFGNRKTSDDPRNARTLSRILRGDMTCAGATCP
jgi:arylsulfatase A-like enzyme